MKIFDKNNNLRLDVEVDDSSVANIRLQDDQSLTLHYSLPNYLDLEEGDYCDFQGIRYTLLEPSKFKVLGSRIYEYTVIFEAPAANAKKYLMRDTTSQNWLKFSLTAKPQTFLKLFVDNMNRRESGWTVGQCIEADEVTVTFNNTNCLDALSKIAKAFSTEFEIVNKTVNLRKVEYNKSTPLELRYGKGGGFLPGCGRENFSSDKPCEILFAIGGNRNIDASKYGSTELHLPAGGTIGYDGVKFSDEAGYDSSNGRLYKVSDDNRSVIRADKALITNVEDCLDATDIYPSRVGTVSAVTTELGKDSEGNEFTFYDIADSSIPETLNYLDCLIAGQTMTIIFQSGVLAGREFDVEYVHDGRKFKIVPAELDGYQMPSGVLIPKVGDKYAVFGCMLPASYINDAGTKSGAEWDMFRFCVKYKYENEDPLYTFTGPLDGIFSESKWLEIGGKIKVGSYVKFSSDTFIDGGFVLIRIVGIKQYVNSPKKPVLELSNSAVSGNFATSVKEKISDAELAIDESNRMAIAYTDRRWHDIKEMQKQLEEDFKNEFSESINPVTIDTMQLIVGYKQLQFLFVNSKVEAGQKQITVYPNIDNSTNIVTLPAAILKHMTLGVSTTTISSENKYKYWDVAAYTSPPIEDDKMYRLYVKCNKNGTDATFMLSENKIELEEVSGFYSLFMGYIGTKVDGKRSWGRAYGFTEILPGQITTEVVQSPNGNLIIDLVTGHLKGPVTITAGSSGYKNLNDLPGSGRNYLNGSGNLKELYCNPEGDTTVVGYDNYLQVNIGSSPGFVRMVFGDDTVYLADESIFKSGEPITFSLEIKGAPLGKSPYVFLNNTSGYLILNYADQTTDGWMRYYVTWVYVPAPSSPGIHVHFVSFPSGTYYLRNFKLEYGSVATDWIPPFSDYVTESEFIVATDRIRLDVIGTYNGMVANNKEIQSLRDWSVNNINDINNAGYMTATIAQSAGFITQATGATLYASASLANGDNIIGYINQSATTTTIHAERINLEGAVTYSMIGGDLLGNVDLYNTYIRALYASGRVDDYDLNWSDKVANAVYGGKTLIAGGYINTQLLDVDTIFANKAYLGKFTLQDGWFTCYSADEGVGYINMEGTNTKVAFGKNLFPHETTPNMTCTAVITNNSIPSVDTGVLVNVGLQVTAKEVNNELWDKVVHSVAIDCNGGLSVGGGLSLFEDIYLNAFTNANSAEELKYKNTFVFFPYVSKNAYLPTLDAMKAAFPNAFTNGLFKWEFGFMRIRILVARWATSFVRVTQGNADTPLINGSATPKVYIDLYAGDYLELGFWHNAWYILNHRN